MLLYDSYNGEVSDRMTFQTLRIKRSGTLPELPSASQASSTSTGYVRPFARANGTSPSCDSMSNDCTATMLFSVCAQNWCC